MFTGTGNRLTKVPSIPSTLVLCKVILVRINSKNYISYSFFRRGARRWRKLYKVNGHIFQAKRFNRKAYCAYCHDRIWGLGRQGFKCTQVS